VRLSLRFLDLRVLSSRLNDAEVTGLSTGSQSGTPRTTRGEFGFRIIETDLKKWAPPSFRRRGATIGERRGGAPNSPPCCCGPRLGMVKKNSTPCKFHSFPRSNSRLPGPNCAMLICRTYAKNISDNSLHIANPKPPPEQISTPAGNSNSHPYCLARRPPIF
jgi:hypothetical protein